LPDAYRHGVEARRKADTQSVGRVTTMPDLDGWQATYEVGLQEDELVLTSVTVQSFTGVPAGGLTARQLRSLRPGTALREFVKAVAENKATWPVSVSQAREMIIAYNEGRPWKAEPDPESLDYVTWRPQALPVFQRLTRGQPVDRRHRIAQTAALYVEAIASGHPAPRKRVADLQGRSEGAVRDDLHAARHESPALLTMASRGRSGGTLTKAAMAMLEEAEEAER
jgi:hypothetical protein